MLSPSPFPLSILQKCIPNSWKPIESPPNSLHFNNQSLLNTLLSSITTFASQPNFSKAFNNYSLLKTHVPSSSLLIIQAISALLSPRLAPRYGELLHAHIIVLGHQQNPVLVPKLVHLYSSFGHLNEAHLLFEDSSYVGSVCSWNVLISAYLRHGFYWELLCAYKQMVDRGVRPDSFTYTSVFKACGCEFDLGFGRWVHWSMDCRCLRRRRGLYVHNALVSMYVKCGQLNVARSLFEKMPVRDVVSWNSMISGYACKGMWEEAFEMIERMCAENAKVNVVTWNIMARGCLRTGNYKGVLGLIARMRSRGVSLDSVTVLTGLVACSQAGFGKLGKEIHGFAVRGCHDGAENVKNAMITMYSQCKYLKQAYKLFCSMESKSLITWNTMIAGCACLDRLEETTSIFREMLAFSFEPNYVTIVTILSLCARMVNLRHGRELHCYILRRETFVDYLLLNNALVDLYSKSGKILEAQRLFEFMDVKDKVTYTSLIAGYGMQGKGRTSLKLFEEMKAYGIKPDHVTMVAILSACSHSGLVSQGEMLFQNMAGEYQINPRMEHFSCMVELYGRAGLLIQAKQVIMEMPFQPSPAILAILLVACRINGNILIGEWAADYLLQLRPEKLEFYGLIANMYSNASSWSKLAKVTTLMKALCMGNDPFYVCADAVYGGYVAVPLAFDSFEEYTGAVELQFTVYVTFQWELFGKTLITVLVNHGVEHVGASSQYGASQQQ
ncbi:hypothetical protein Scep_013708 [Stephania cephalantha]|uniref:Pentatricopeptide repeat-containing protein n=1 Tax=Stephania cephalantha TaxID=152367 RepID=A0AAP0J1Y0_9MAGN